MIEQEVISPEAPLDVMALGQEMTLDPSIHLMSLPHEGFTPEYRQQITDQIVAVGLPVDNYTRLVHAPNKRGTENHLGSWGIGSVNYGEFTVYERLEQEIPEQRLAVIAHEGAHANTPLRHENAYLFGGEVERAEAETFAYDLAAQTMITKKYLTGYHKYLGEQLVAGEITYDDFAEETQAIASELALTNRAKLEQVEIAQKLAMTDLRRAGQLSKGVKTVNLISKTDKTGAVTADGIDKQLIALIKGVSSPEDLIRHSINLKARFYPEHSFAVVSERLVYPVEFYIQDLLLGAALRWHEEESSKRTKKTKETTKVD